MTVTRKGFLIAFVLSFAFFYVMMALAGASPSRASRNQYVFYGWQSQIEYRHARVRHHHSHHAHHHRRGPSIDASGNLALATVVTADGLTAKVAAPVQEKFQQLIKLVEADTVYPERPDLDERGNRIKDIGCYTRGGHMPGSKHYRGLACDFDQTKRNVTSAFMYHVTPLAKLVGLTDGATWPRLTHERYTGPDAGHIEVPSDGETISATRHSRRHYAHRHHRHYRRYARAS
jgi:hypothetical protein